MKREFVVCPYCETSLKPALSSAASRQGADPEDESNGTGRLGGVILFETETAWFALANVLDIVLTFLLIRRGEFFEANPIARHFINHWGLKGMIGFKLGLVVLVILITQIVARQRPQLARAVLIFGTIVVTAVVIYSVSLHRQFVG